MGKLAGRFSRTARQACIWRGGVGRVLTVVLAASSLAVAPANASQPPAPCSGSQRLTIPDPSIRKALQNVIRGKLGRTDIPFDQVPLTCDTLKLVTEISMNAQASSLEGLQYASNLTSLRLLSIASPSPQPRPAQLTTISDLRPLQDLPHLQQLAMWGGYLADLSPLSRIDDLQQLAFIWVKVGGLAPLTRLRHLERLSISVADLHDLAPLRTWTHPPKIFRFNENNIRDLEPLVDNPAIGPGTTINLNYNCLDLTPGSPAQRQIDALEARGVNVEAVPRSQAPNAEHCQHPPTIPSCSGSQPITIPDPVLRGGVQTALGLSHGDQPVACNRLRDLTNLDLHPARPISSLDGLAYAPYLQRFTLVNPPDAPSPDITPIAALRNLTSLTLDVGDFAHPERLAALAHLRTLTLRGVNVPQLRSLPNGDSLESLTLTDAGLIDIEGLLARGYTTEGSYGINANLTGNRIRDLSPLVQQPRYGRPGITLNLAANCLDLTPGSPTQRDIGTLRQRGVHVVTADQRTNTQDCQP